MGSLRAPVPKDMTLSHHHRMKKLSPNVKQFYKSLSVSIICFTAVNITTHIFQSCSYEHGLWFAQDGIQELINSKDYSISTKKQGTYVTESVDHPVW